MIKEELKAVTAYERTALAMLRSGASWQEASDATHIPVERLRELWAAGVKGA